MQVMVQTLEGPPGSELELASLLTLYLLLSCCAKGCVGGSPYANLSLSPLSPSPLPRSSALGAATRSAGKPGVGGGCASTLWEETAALSCCTDQ